MARRTLVEDLYRLTSQVPWWVATLLGGGFFYVFKVYLPTQVSETLRPAWTPMLTVFAWGLLGICLLGALTSLFCNLRDRRLFERQSSLKTIRELSWPDFERFVLEAYRRQGFDARSTQAGADGGVDIVLTRDSDTTLVQCKHWKTRRVGVKAIRELAGVVAAKKAIRGIFVCSGSYTVEADSFAGQANIELVDGRALEALIGSVQDNRKAATVLFAQTDVCPRCGGGLVRRVAKRGKRNGEAFLGCGTFPKCRYSRSL